MATASTLGLLCPVPGVVHHAGRKHRFRQNKFTSLRTTVQPANVAYLPPYVMPLLRLRPVRCVAGSGTDTSESTISTSIDVTASFQEVFQEKTVRQIREEMIRPLRTALNESIARQTKATGVREALEAEVCALFERVINAEGSDVNVEEVAAAAMQAVESALKDEVEAAAVVAATQAAMDKTLAELQALSGDIEIVEAEVILAEAPITPAEPLAAMVNGNGSTTVSVSSTVDETSMAGPAVDMPKPAAAETVQLLESLTVSQALKTVDGAPLTVRLVETTGLTTTGAALPKTGATSSDSKAKRIASQQKKAKAMIVGGLVLASAVAGYAFLQSSIGQSFIVAVSDFAAGIMERIGVSFGPIHVGEAERGLLETIWLLLTSIVCVPAVCKLIPGGSPVLGYLIGGALVGPHALNIISDVHQVQHLAELGVVFLLFNIGLELSLDRLQSMAKYVFGMGAAQVVLTLLGVAAFAVTLAHLSGSSAIILGGALAMSTTAVAIQVLEDRGEMGSRHGRATFSVLLFQDLAVVVLLMLIPLLAPDPSGQSSGVAKIAKALGVAAVKAAVCIAGIIAGGRIFLRPLYKKISGLANAEIFAATTLLVVLGTSFMTQLAGLSLALGAFLAGLLLAETEYALQVESDIAPYKGLLMGLFFMTVGMEISVPLFIAQWKNIISAIVILLVGKLAVMVAAGQMFGLSRMASIRAGLLLASGGEFAFVAFGEAVSKGVLPAALISQLYLVVALSMALTPYLAAIGGKLGQMFERSDMKALQPQDNEVKEMKNHVIIAGYGRVGQIIAQMLSEQLIPFVALDVRSDRVQAGKALDLPVYFGDAGSPAVLHSVGAERASCAVITLDTPGANYRSVWAMHKHFPGIKTYVRAHDVNHGINLEKAGATAVVPETLEPSLQLAAAVLSQYNLPYDEVTSLLDGFRKKHLRELQALAAQSGTSLGYMAPKQDMKKDDLKGDGQSSDDLAVAAVVPTLTSATAA
eukprot:jgi/Chrzof1/3810/Cz13g09190.t1_KEA1[v5.2]